MENRFRVFRPIYNALSESPWRTGTKCDDDVFRLVDESLYDGDFFEREGFDFGTKRRLANLRVFGLLLGCVRGSPGFRALSDAMGCDGNDQIKGLIWEYVTELGFKRRHFQF